MNIKEVILKNREVKDNSVTLKSLSIIGDLDLPPQQYFTDLKDKRINAMDKLISENKEEFGDMFSLICDLRMRVNEYTGTFIVGCNDYCIDLMVKETIEIVNIFDKIAILLTKYKQNQDLNSYYKVLNGFSRGKFKNMLIKDLDYLAKEHSFSYDKKQVSNNFK